MIIQEILNVWEVQGELETVKPNHPKLKLESDKCWFFLFF